MARRIFILLAGFVWILLNIEIGRAQERTQTPQLQLDELRKELEQLKDELIELKKSREEALFEETAEMERLEERLEGRLRELENKIDAVSRAYAPVAFNPRTTAFLNVAARADNEEVLDSEGEAEIHNRTFLRSVEVDLRAPVDPYAEAVTILAVEDKAGKGFEIDVEEAYGLIKRLPLFETAPLGMKVKIGKFRVPMGLNNRLHLHDLPWTTRPLAVSKYLGTEHGEFFESGFSAVGIDFDFFLPSPIPSSTLEFNFDLLRAGDIGLSQGNHVKQPAYLAHLTWSKDWRNEHLLTLGLSAYRETDPASPRLYAVDLTYKWIPAVRRDRHSLVLGGEVFLGRYEKNIEGNSDNFGHLAAIPAERNKPLGWYAYVQYQLSWWSYVGARYEVVDEPSNDELKTKVLSGYLSYYTTEFLRFRFGVDHRRHDWRTPRSIVSGFFEINFVFGSHPTEPYWVSR